MTDLSAEVKKASDAGKCFSPADTELKLPKYTTLQNYEQNPRLERAPLVRPLGSRHLSRGQRRSSRYGGGHSAGIFL